MLTIGKVGRSRGRLQYYDAQVAAGLEDYYAGRGESPGRWRGTGATALGLTARSPVKRVEFMALMSGQHPVDRSALRAMGARSTVSAFDLTFSAPKSVSVLFAIGDDHTAAELLAAHEHAVEVALSYLERDACFTRRGRDGVDRVSGEGFSAASYRHRMSRAGDPQLHTHVVVANMTRADGRYTALDGRALYEHKSAGGAVYRAVLRAQVRQRLPWASWHQVGRGLFELDGVPDQVLRHFSQRRVEIEERALELTGLGAGELSRERTQGIALATRRAKRYGIDGASWREEARARAAEHGLGQTELEGLAARRPSAADEPDLARAIAALSGPGGLTEQHNSFARRHALAELAGAFIDGVGLEELDSVTDRFLAEPGVAQLRPDDHCERYTTLELLALERDLVEGAQRRAEERTGVIATGIVERILAGHQPVLNDEQQTVIREITADGRGLETVTALAGTGKTTIVGALATAYTQAGWRVIGVAPTARAARQLRDTAGIDADTVHALTDRLKREGGLDSRTLLVLDEAGMAPTRLTSILFAHAELAGAKVVAIGDPGQLQAVQAGGWLAAIARENDGRSLRQVLRQHDPGEREALAALHDGDPEPYLIYKRDAISVHETETEALIQARDQWYAAQRQHGRRGAVMIARDNLTRERLNQAARALLKQDGALDERGVYVGGREYSPGDRVVARRNDRANDIDNGTTGTVLGTDRQQGSLTVRADDGRVRCLERDYVVKHVEHAYALTGHAAQGATLAWAAVIGRPADFTREWAYTALSRARQHTRLHVISEPAEHDLERHEYAPLEPKPEIDKTGTGLASAMRRSELEPLAYDRLPDVQEATVARPPSLAGVAALRRAGDRELRLKL